MSKNSKKSKKSKRQSSLRSVREQTLSLWRPDSDGIHIFYNPYYKSPNKSDAREYWGHLGNLKHYNHLKDSGDMVTLVGFAEQIPKKNIHFPRFVINPDSWKNGTNQRAKYDISKESEEAGFGKTVHPSHFNALINTLQYDENDGDIWGARRYPCGANLPGNYFDREIMLKETTFIAISVVPHNVDIQQSNTADYELEDFIGTRAAIHRYITNRAETLLENYPEYFEDKKYGQKQLIEKMKTLYGEQRASSKKADDFDLTGFLVVKDLNNKPARSEPFIYIEGLCSNVRGGGAKLLDLANIMGFNMGYTGTKLAALTMVISYYFSKFNFRHYDDDFTSTTTKKYIPEPCGMDQAAGAGWENYLTEFMKSGTDLNQKWRDNRQDLDIEHFHRLNSIDWSNMIGIPPNKGKYPHLNAGSPWLRRSERIQTPDEDMGDMGYYMYLPYNDFKKFPRDEEALAKFTPTTRYILGVGSPPSITLEDPLTCYERCTKKGNGFCKKICGFLGVEKYKKQGGRTRRKKRRRRKTKKRRKYKNKKTRRRKYTRKKN